MLSHKIQDINNATKHTDLKSRYKTHHYRINHEEKRVIAIKSQQRKAIVLTH